MPGGLLTASLAGRVQVCLDKYSNGIPNLNLNNLNLRDRVSDGLSIIRGTSALASAQGDAQPMLSRPCVTAIQE